MRMASDLADLEHVAGASAYASTATGAERGVHLGSLAQRDGAARAGVEAGPAQGALIRMSHDGYGSRSRN